MEARQYNDGTKISLLYERGEKQKAGGGKVQRKEQKCWQSVVDDWVSKKSEYLQSAHYVSADGAIRDSLPVTNVGDALWRPWVDNGEQNLPNWLRDRLYPKKQNATPFAFTTPPKHK